jgi:zinc protease
VIGWAEDVERITPEAMRAFYRAYYAPNNALVVAVGDFRAPEVLARITRRFGPIPRGPDPPAVLAVEPRQAGERRVVVKRQAELPIVPAYHAQRIEETRPPAESSPRCSGRSGLPALSGLVSEGQIALEAGGDYTAFMLTPTCSGSGPPVAGQKPEAMEAALLAQMDQLKAEPVQDEELRRAKNQIEADLVFARDSVHRRANQLAHFELLGGYALAAPFLDRIRAVTAADLLRVARTYFPSERKNVGILLPGR